MSAPVGTVWQPGSPAFRRFTLKEPIERGSLVEEWLALDPIFGREIVLQKIPDPILSLPEAINHVRREVGATLILGHPHVARVFDLVADPSGAAVVSQWVPGKSLADHLAERPDGRFTLGERLRTWLREACDALRFAHETAGVIHRDIRPESLIIDESGKLRVHGFGLGMALRDAEAHEFWTPPANTRACLCPQVAQLTPAHPTDDVYGLAATIFLLLSGQPPSPGLSGPVIQSAIPDLPVEWVDTLAHALSYDSGSRPRSIADLAHALALKRDPARPDPQPASVPAATALPQRPEFRRGGLSSTKTWPRIWLLATVGAFFLGLAMGAVLFRSPARSESLAAPGTRPKPGSLMVRTDPLGATVSLDGGPGQVSPFLFKDVSAGLHVVRAELDGHEPSVSEVTVEPGKLLELPPLQLEPSVGSIEFLSRPDNAEIVLINATSGEEVLRARTPETLERLPAGAYIARFKIDGAPPVERSVRLRAGRSETVSVEFDSNPNPRGPAPAPPPVPEPPPADVPPPPAAPSQSSLPSAPAAERDEPPITSSAGIELKWLPAGFWAGRTEVTWAQYNHVAASPNAAASSAHPPNHPVTSVSWNEAVANCNELTQLDRIAGILQPDVLYRLPTDMEWSYLAESARPQDSIDSRESPRTGPEPVGSRGPNTFGLVDLRGNVWEWSADRTRTESDAPGHHARGGSWSDTEAAQLRPWFRLGPFPPEHRAPNIGFRIVAVHATR